MSGGPPGFTNIFKSIGISTGNIGTRLGDVIAGHSVLIPQPPVEFNRNLAMHFLLVESTLLLPTFTLSISHYFSSLCMSQDRHHIIAPLFNETFLRSEMQQFWLSQVAGSASPDFKLHACRIGILMYQITTFSMWIVLSAVFPSISHTILSRASHIMSRKYGAIELRFPNHQMHSKYLQTMQAAENFHRKNSGMRIDPIGAFFIFVIVFMRNKKDRSGGQKAAAPGSALQSSNW
jgi:hypothetical protein